MQTNNEKKKVKKILEFPDKKSERKYNIINEVFNSVTHGLGVIAGIVFLILLIFKAQTKIEYIAYSIYAGSFILLFLASTLYHSLSFTKAKSVFQVIDHSSIFLLIAGTYTPYCLLSIQPEKGYPLIGIIWGIAIFGILFKIINFELARKFSLPLYLIMGWLCITAITDIYKSIGITGILLLALGGLTYTVGTYFYKKRDMKYSHVIWHLFVLGGAILMFFSIYFFV